MSIKQLREPEKYNGDRTHYKEWREELHAYTNAHDVTLTRLLMWVEDLGRMSFKPEDLLDLAEDMELDASDLIEAKTALHTLLMNYTTGKARNSVRKFKTKGVFEAYRRLHFAGVRLTPKVAFQEKCQLWKVEEATLDIFWQRWTPGRRSLTTRKKPTVMR